MDTRRHGGARGGARATTAPHCRSARSISRSTTASAGWYTNALPILQARDGSGAMTARALAPRPRQSRAAGGLSPYAWKIRPTWSARCSPTGGRSTAVANRPELLRSRRSSCRPEVDVSRHRDADAVRRRGRACAVLPLRGPRRVDGQSCRECGCHVPRSARTSASRPAVRARTRSPHPRRPRRGRGGNPGHAARLRLPVSDTRICRPAT